MNEELKPTIEELEAKIKELEIYQKWYFEEVEKNRIQKRFIENIKESIELFITKK